jgi:hypothetical protein
MPCNNGLKSPCFNHPALITLLYKMWLKLAKHYQKLNFSIFLKKSYFDENYGVNVSVNKVQVLLFYLNVAKVHFLVVLATNAINKSCRGHHFV